VNLSLLNMDFENDFGTDLCDNGVQICIDERYCISLFDYCIDVLAFVCIKTPFSAFCDEEEVLKKQQIFQHQRQRTTQKKKTTLHKHQIL
jgi:hypothetical protein